MKYTVCSYRPLFTNIVTATTMITMADGIEIPSVIYIKASSPKVKYINIQSENELFDSNVIHVYYTRYILGLVL